MKKFLFTIILFFCIILPVNSEAVNLKDTENCKYIISDTSSDIVSILPKTSVIGFKDKFAEAEFIDIYTDADCLNEIEDGIIGTGMFLKAIGDKKYQLGVIGDLDGDGYISNSDIKILSDYLLHKENDAISGVFFKAADLNFDNKLDQVDLTLMIRYKLLDICENIDYSPIIIRIDDKNGEEYVPDTWVKNNIYVSLNPLYIVTNKDVKVSYEVKGANVVDKYNTEELILTNEGISTLIVTEDYANGESISKEYIIKIDNSAPDISDQILRLDNFYGEEYEASTWTNKNVYLKLIEGIDAGCGSKYTTFEITGASNAQINDKNEVLITEHGITSVKIVSEDILGNRVEKDIVIKIDKELPKSPIIKVVEGTKNTETTWYTESVGLQLFNNKTDDMDSGIEKLTYEVIGEVNTKEQEIIRAKKIRFEKDGKYIIKAYNYDKAGNKSEAAIFEILLDATKPTGSSINIQSGTLGRNDWYTSDVKLQFIKGRDYTSNIKNMSYKISGTVTKNGFIANKAVEIGEYITEEIQVQSGEEILLAAEGIYEITLSIYDNAGNKEEVIRIIKIDKLNDVKYEYHIEGTKGNNGYYKSNIEISLSWNTDITSGIEKIKYNMLGAIQDEGILTEPDEKILVDKDGTTNIIITAYDYAGNIYSDTLELKKDVIAPNNVHISYKDSNSNGYTLVASANDETSGIYQYNFYIDGELYESINSSENMVECIAKEQSVKIHEAYVIVLDMAGYETISNEISIEPVRQTKDDIECFEFVIEEFKLLKNTNIVDEGLIYFVSDTSSTSDSKYIQIIGNENNVTGLVAGHTRIIKKNGEIIEDLKYYPKDIIFNISYYSSGSGNSWKHIFQGNLYGTELFNKEDTVETSGKIEIGVLNRHNNTFNFTEQKQIGVEAYTRIIIQSINCGDTLIPFRILNEI